MAEPVEKVFCKRCAEEKQGPSGRCACRQCELCNKTYDTSVGIGLCPCRTDGFTRDKRRRDYVSSKILGRVLHDALLLPDRCNEIRIVIKNGDGVMVQTETYMTRGQLEDIGAALRNSYYEVPEDTE